MHFEIPYAHQTVQFDIPDRNLAFYVHRSNVRPAKSTRELVIDALKQPIGTSPINRLVKGKDKITVLVDDITRPTPVKEVLPPVLEQLCSDGVKEDKVEIIIGLGTHRPMSDSEMKDHLSPEVVERFTVSNHNFKDETKLLKLGTTKLGIPALVNKSVVNSDFVVSVGNIVPHNAAGWGGGAKMILPGVSGEESVGMLHIAAGKVRPMRDLVATLDNPMRRDINAIARKAGLDVIVNTVLNSEDKPIRVFAGDPDQAFREGVETARQVFCQNVTELADVIVFSTYPADIDYWQAMKALDFAHVGVRKGGTIIMITPCPEGISSMHTTFGAYATRPYSEILEGITKKQIGDLPAAGALLMHAQLREHAHIICYSAWLKKEDKQLLGFEHAPSIEEALQVALKRHGESARIGVLECGEIVPVCSAQSAGRKS
jgi:nickel-dependent lactate racemase